MIPPRLARRFASIHKWLGLVVFLQLLVWTGTGLFFTLFPIAQIHGDHLLKPAREEAVDLSKVKLSMAEALQAVAEDQPYHVTLRNLAGVPVYEVSAPIGGFLISAESGERLSPISAERARHIAEASWLGGEKSLSAELVKPAPRESGMNGAVWAVRFPGDGEPRVYVSASNGRLGPVRTDLWRTYDFLWSLHIMDYSERENYHHPLIFAAAVLALSTVAFGVALLIQRFTVRRA